MLGAKGTWENDQLVVGQRFDLSGKLEKEVNVPRDRELAALAAREKEEKDKREKAAQRAADERIRKETEALAEQAVRDRLNTMNAGQLFAYADELSAAGDKAKARDALRALVRRFPDHPLAAAVAERMANLSGSNSGAANGGSNNGGAAGSGSNSAANTGNSATKRGDCESLLEQFDKELKVKMRRPTPSGSTPPLMRLMWATQESIKIIDANCPTDPKQSKFRDELKRVYDEAKESCRRMSVGECSPNPY